MNEPRQGPAAALAELTGPLGPPRFAAVTPTLYRSGQPEPAHLPLLKELGVRTIVHLRREGRPLRLAEATLAAELGMTLLSFPFYGVFGASDAFLDRILAAVTAPEHAPVLVHCREGKDRTSLVIALYRVRAEGWDADDAWQREVLDYGHVPTAFYSAIRRAYRRHLAAR